MPNKYVDPESGAVIYMPTPQERKEQDKEKLLYDLAKEVKCLKALIFEILGANTPAQRQAIEDMYFNKE